MCFLRVALFFLSSALKVKTKRFELKDYLVAFFTNCQPHLTVFIDSLDSKFINITKEENKGPMFCHLDYLAWHFP